MKILRKKQRNDILTAADWNALLEAINEIKIVHSPDVRMTRTAGGTALTVVKQPVGAAQTVAADTSPGGVVELHQEWVNTVYSWRENERVIYKPTGSAYYLVYQCNDAAATSTDIPGTSAKWTKVTAWTDEAYWLIGTAYTVGQKVLYLGGIYTAALASTGVEPGTNEAVWTFTSDSLIGIKSYPMQIDSEDVFTPYAEYYSTGIKYDYRTPDATTNKLYFGQRKKTFYIDGTSKVEPVSDLVEWAPAIDHG